MNKTYPVYKLSAKWEYTTDDCPDIKKNSLGHDFMEREILTNEETEKYLEKFVTDLRASEEEKGRHVCSPIKLDLKQTGLDTWCQGWFNHWTFNQFASEEEAFADFLDYVNSIERKNMVNGHRPNGIVYDNPEPFECLMGAEDHWRWKLCHCEICAEQGITTITH